MILLVWNSGKARDCGTALEQKLGEPVHAVSNLSEGCERLRSAQYSAVVLDDSAVENQEAMADLLFAQLGSSVPVFINFSISSIQRISWTVRSALSRRRIDTELARQATRLELRSEVKDDVTAILLSCAIGLEDAGLNDSGRGRFVQIEELAKRMKSRLAADAEEHKAAAAKA